MKKVLILGGGFGGVACGLELAKYNLRDTKVKIVNDHEYHVLSFALYQAATREQSSRNVAIPLTTIFDNKKVNIKISKVEKINPESNQVRLKNDDTLSYDYLVLALGSETEDYNIPGVKGNAYTLKSLYDSAKLRNAVRMLFENACNDKSTRFPLKVCIGGGGFAGTELAGELHKYCNTLAKEFNLPPNCFEVSIIQSGDQLLNGLDIDTALKAKQRVEGLHVKVILGSHITKVDKNLITLENGRTVPFDLLVWTVGVRSNSIVKNSGLPVDKTGRVLVEKTLQAKDHPNIFAIGDCAYFPVDTEGHSAAGVAPVAIDEAKVATKNIHSLLSANPLPLTAYTYHHHGYIVPISGRFALARLDFFKADGFWAYMMQQLTVLYYLLSILPIIKAFYRFDNFEMELSNED